MNRFEKHHSHEKQKNTMLKLIAAFLILAVAVLFLVSCATGKHSCGKIDTDTSQTASRYDTKYDNTDIHSDSESISNPEEPTDKTSDWNLILVNPWNRIPEDLTVELTQLENGQAIDKRVYNDLQAMMDAARDEGLSPLICSSYRTNEKQQTLYNNEVKRNLAKGYTQKDAETEAGKWVAVPGTSEHQTGLAVDIVDLNYQILDEGQEKTPVQKWLMENSYKYGFILRYPNDKSNITGINYEPWHYRYVGKKAAKEIYEKGICLEEYLEGLN